MNLKVELLQLLLLQTAHFKSVLNCVKGTVHLKMNILSSFTHPHAVGRGVSGGAHAVVCVGPNAPV